jgi:Brp/Blh family beta-carotene 15,15'-monooxygenase
MPVLTNTNAIPLMPFFVHHKSMRYALAVFVVALYGVLQFAQLTDSYLEYVFLGLGFLAVGIPHGALDHLLLREKRRSLFVFVTEYVSVVVLYFVMWHYLPLVSLLVFILFSAFHFGESEYEMYGIQSESFKSYINAFFLGLSILVFISSTHVQEVSQLLISYKASWSVWLNKPWIAPVSMGLAVLSLGYIVVQALLAKFKAFTGLIFILILGIPAPLLLSFGLYFVVQHSSNAWQHMQAGLKMSSFTMYKKALPFTLGALGILGLIFLLNTSVFQKTDHYMGSIFTFLSCISLPHFMLMHLFYKGRGKAYGDL